MGLKFNYRNNFESVRTAYADSDFASNVSNRKSISRFILKLFDNTIFWKTKKQATVSLSSAEAEYIALSECTTEATYVSKLLI